VRLIFKLNLDRNNKIVVKRTVKYSSRERVSYIVVKHTFKTSVVPFLRKIVDSKCTLCI
jgi:hypothetical protein